MLSRRGSSLGCRSACRSLFTPARVLAYPRIRPHARPLPAQSELITEETVHQSTRAPEHNTTAEALPTTGLEATSDTSSTIVPWFMEYNKQLEVQFPLERRDREPTPKVPENSPSILQPLAEYMTQDLLLKDISLLDLRGRENPWGDNAIMVVCTARSERQLRSSAEFLKGYLRKLGLKPRVEGLINWEDTKVKRRRRRKMIGRANYQIEDDLMNWVFVDVGGDSGLILQLFSEEGRREYALEELWQGRANNVVELPAKFEEQPGFERESAITTASASHRSIGPLGRRLFSTASNLNHAQADIR